MGICMLFLHLLTLAVISCFWRLTKIHLLKLISFFGRFSGGQKKSARVTFCHGCIRITKVSSNTLTEVTISAPLSRKSESWGNFSVEGDAWEPHKAFHIKEESMVFQGFSLRSVRREAEYGTTAPQTPLLSYRPNNVQRPLDVQSLSACLRHVPFFFPFSPFSFYPLLPLPAEGGNWWNNGHFVFPRFNIHQVGGGGYLFLAPGRRKEEAKDILKKPWEDF